MLSFENDYSHGAHEKILQRLMETNMDAQVGYGFDEYTESAKNKIRQACGCEDAEVYFLVGGTQTNQVVIDTLLEDYEGVISATSGHVNGHEAGAIEFSGHKVLAIPGHEGKLNAGEVRAYISSFYNDRSYEHMVFPGMVYVSYPTEYGTLYTKQELLDIKAVCKEYDIPLYLDGARLGYGLMSYESDLTLQDIASICDAFYIGGTKVGALFGEAVVFTKNNIPKHFMTRIKQHGALLAKGKVLGVQFDTLFTDDLYFTISRHAIDCAKELKKIFAEKGYSLYLDSPTNQQFVILDNAKMEELKDKVRYCIWEPYDENHTVVRFATCWATTHEDLQALREIL